MVSAVACLVCLPTNADGTKLTAHSSSGGAIVYCSSPAQDGPMTDYVKAYIRVRRLSATPGAPPPSAYIESITLALSSVGVHDVESFSWDILQAAVDLPLVSHLRFEGLDGREYEDMKKILCSVLPPSQLTWALESGKLQFMTFDADPVTSADVLSVSTKHVAEQAEWLLHPVNHSLLATRKECLPKLVTARASLGAASSAAGGVRAGQVQVR